MAPVTRLAPALLAALCAGAVALPAPARQPDTTETPTELINRTLSGVWKQSGAAVPRKATDAEFARTLYPDLLGRAPTAAEVAALEADKGADKRAKLITTLLADKAWSEHWAGLWTSSLIPSDYNAAYTSQFRKWLAGRLAAGAPYSQVVVEMLTATGKTTDNGGVHFVVANLGDPLPRDKAADGGLFDMVPVTALTGSVFLGQGFACLACHSHPFTADLRQRDFWGVNAFFRQAERVGEPRANAANVLELKDNADLCSDGVVKFMRRTGFMDATGLTFLNGRSPHADDLRPRRAILSGFVVRHKNFAPVAVNRTWTELLGRGMLENADMTDLCDSNEPLYPDLLAGLAEALQGAKYDQRRLIAAICNSDVYQLHAVPTDKDDPYFFRAKKPKERGFKNIVEPCNRKPPGPVQSRTP